MQIHHAIKRHIEMRIMNSALAVIMLRRVMTFHIQVAVGVVVIRQLAHMRIHIAAQESFVDRSFDTYIKCQRA